MSKNNLIMLITLSVLGVVLAMGLTPETQPGDLPTLTPTPTVEPQSVFAGDTCNPPCWFGLLPGESTSSEVETMFANFDEVFAWDSQHGRGNVFDATTGYVVDGGYAFWWRDFERDVNSQFSSSIAVEAGVVRFIYAEAPQVMLLGETIDLLGTPDDIHLSFYQHGHTLTLIYVDARLRVYFYAPHSPCRTTNMLRDFTLTDVHYLSPDAAVQVVEGDDGGDVRALVAVSYGSKQVPVEVWDQWTVGEVDLTCGSAYNNLPETVNLLPLDPETWETITPITSATAAPMATLTPAPLATADARSHP